MYQEISKLGRFVRGLIDSGYRIDCYYEKFSSDWRKFHKSTLEGMEVDARIHHRDEESNDGSLVNWILNFGSI